MREIKFRAWDAEREQMFTSPKWVEFTFRSGALTAKNYNRSGMNQELVTMQYTGLKDKNGVEIYEGDVLDYPPKEHFGGVVIFEDGSFMVKHDSGSDSCIDSDFKVIGNIHESPELLES